MGVGIPDGVEARSPVGLVEEPGDHLGRGHALLPGPQCDAFAQALGQLYRGELRHTGKDIHMDTRVHTLAHLDAPQVPCGLSAGGRSPSKVVERAVGRPGAIPVGGRAPVET